MCVPFHLQCAAISEELYFLQKRGCHEGVPV